MSCDGVAVLDKGATIASARRLVAEHDNNAEPVNITWAEYSYTVKAILTRACPVPADTATATDDGF